MNAKPTTVDAYLDALPEGVRGPLDDLRRLIRSLAPTAVESISYGMPGYKYLGRPLTYFAAWKRHWALYAMDAAAHRDALLDYTIGENGTIQFPLGQPLPKGLITTLVNDRMAAIEAAPSRAGRR